MELGATAKDITSVIDKYNTREVTPKDVSRETRQFLSDAYSFLQGESSNQNAAVYGLSEAIQDRIDEIEGIPPHLPKKKNLLDRLDYLLTNVDTVVASLIGLSDEDLTATEVLGFGDGGVSSYLESLGKQVGTSKVSEVFDTTGLNDGKYIPNVPTADDLADSASNLIG